MKQRARKPGATINAEFEDFGDFLSHMGPRPDPKYTLDRIDHNNPEYGPGLCEWKDKKEQANNRRSTIRLTYKGKCLPLTTWAKKTKQRADTMRKHRLAGWSDAEIIEGKHSSENKTAKLSERELIEQLPWPGDSELKIWCEKMYQRHGRESEGRYDFLHRFAKEISDDADRIQRTEIVAAGLRHTEDYYYYSKRCSQFYELERWAARQPRFKILAVIRNKRQFSDERADFLGKELEGQVAEMVSKKGYYSSNFLPTKPVKKK